jgi:protein ImuB
MTRVAALWLPTWPIDRLRRAEPTLAPAPPERRAPNLAALGEQALAEQATQCDAPRNTHWRPGARWAREEVQASIEQLPLHQRPSIRELGRRSEAAPHPFRAMPPDEGAPPSAARLPERPSAYPPGHWRNPNGQIDHARSPFDGIDPNADDRAAGAIARWNAMPSIRYPGEGPHPNKMVRRGSNDPHAKPPGVVPFFDTARVTANAVARTCPDEGARAAAPHAPNTGDGVPLVTVHKIGSRVEIAAVSPAAQAQGITRGTALTQARASVPGLVVRDADPEGDRAELTQLAMLLARRWAPSVAIDGDDGLLIDLTGVAHLHGGERRMARRLVRMLARAGFAARVAVADTAGAAHALARHRAAFCHSGERNDAVWVCPPDTQADALASLPTPALRIDPHAVELLRRLGVDTIGQLAAMPRAPLARRFGEAIVRRLDQAFGRAPEPLVPVAVPERIEVAERFAEPIATPEAIAASLGRLVSRLADALAAAGQGALRIELVADRVDHQPQRVRIGLARPNRDAQHLLRLITRKIEEIEPGYGIDVMTLHVRRARPLGPEPVTERLDEERAPDLAPLVDTLATRDCRLWRSTPVESDVPERSVATAPPLDPPARAAPPLKREDVRRLDARAAAHPWHPRWPRPARLLARPERVDNVVALLPDGAPRRFTWRGKAHTVVAADGPERIHGEWWRRAAERDAVRDYFQVEDEGGQRFWLYCRADRDGGEAGAQDWYLHGAFG